MKMKKRVWLPICIGLILAAMCLPWAIQIPTLASPEADYYYYYFWLFYPLGLFNAYPLSTVSTLLALIAFPFSFFKGKKSAITCGILLLLSGLAQLYMGFWFGFHWYTPLTWIIVISLFLLGVVSLMRCKNNAK